jgi:hypothetical protein
MGNNYKNSNGLTVKKKIFAVPVICSWMVNVEDPDLLKPELTFFLPKRA